MNDSIQLSSGIFVPGKYPFPQGSTVEADDFSGGVVKGKVRAKGAEDGSEGSGPGFDGAAGEDVGVYDGEGVGFAAEEGCDSRLSGCDAACQAN